MTPTTWPPVTVVTATCPGRHGSLLGRCVPSVMAQTYRGPVEHVVVSGPDPALREKMARRYPHVRHHEMEAHVADGGATPRRIGSELASHEILASLDDDNAYRPAHLEFLVGALLGRGVDFAYSQMLRRPFGDVIGAAQPQLGGIDTSIVVYRRALLTHATWEKITWSGGGRSTEPDWDVVSRWLEAGATWAHVPEVTLDYWAQDCEPADEGDA